MTRPLLAGLVPPDATFALLLAALRWPDGDARQAEIRAAAEHVIDWTRLTALLARHRIAPLVAQGMLAASIALPAPLAEQMERIGQAALLAELQAVSQLRHVQARLEALGIDYRILKGPAQSLRSFGRLGLRTNRDLDLLIAAYDIDSTEQILRDIGYAPTEPMRPLSPDARRRWLRDHKDMVFRSPGAALPIELHWRLFDNRALMPLAPLPGALRIEAAPLQHSPMLDDVTNLRYLCNHGAQHGWSRLKWLADVNALLGQLDAPSIRATYWSSGGRSDPAVGQALVLCADLLGAVLPADIVADLGKSRRALWLARLAWRLIVRSDVAEIEQRAFGSTLKNLSHYALGGGWHYHYEELRFDFCVEPRHGASPPHWGGRIGDWLQRHLTRAARSR